MSIHQSELHRQASHYAAIKAKLYGRPANTNIKTKPVVQVQAVMPPKPKLAPLPRLVALPKRIPTNMWEKARLTFNQHVIDYRIHLLEKERFNAGYGEDSIVPSPKKYKGDLRARRAVIDIVLDVLEDYPDITVDDLRGQCRSRNIVRPRQVAMCEVHKQRPDMSFPAIGRWFGGRDHTTALHAIRKIEAEREREALKAGPYREAAE